MADRKSTTTTVRFLMGVGFDDDGHARLTTGDEFVLVGGSEATHERMQEGVARFQQMLARMGTDLQRASEDEVIEAAFEAGLIDEEE